MGLRAGSELSSAATMRCKPAEQPGSDSWLPRTAPERGRGMPVAHSYAVAPSEYLPTHTSSSDVTKIDKTACGHRAGKLQERGSEVKVRTAAHMSAAAVGLVVCASSSGAT